MSTHQTEIRTIANGICKGFCSCGYTTLGSASRNAVDRELHMHRVNPPQPKG